MMDFKIRRDGAMAVLSKVAVKLEGAEPEAQNKAAEEADRAGLEGAIRVMFVREYELASLRAEIAVAASMVRFAVSRLEPQTRRPGKK